MSEWVDFAVIVGGASAALVGLLFVAISINIGPIARSEGLRARGAQTLVLFVVPLLTAMFLAVPDQGDRVLGLELLGLVLIAGTTLRVLDRRANREQETPGLARTLDHVTPNIVTMLLLAVAGALLVFARNAGLYLLVPAAVSGVVGGVVNAWLFLTRIEPDQS